MVFCDYVINQVCGEPLDKKICTCADVGWHSSIAEVLGLAAPSSVTCYEKAPLENEKRLQKWN